MFATQIQFFVDVSNTGLSDVENPFTLTFSLFVDNVTYQLQLEIPPLEARATKTYKLVFDEIPSRSVLALKNIQRYTSHITAGRVGFYLDITLEEDHLRDQLGWVEENERLNFYIGE